MVLHSVSSFNAFRIREDGWNISLTPALDYRVGRLSNLNISMLLNIYISNLQWDAQLYLYENILNACNLSSSNHIGQGNQWSCEDVWLYSFSNIKLSWSVRCDNLVRDSDVINSSNFIKLGSGLSTRGFNPKLCCQGGLSLATKTVMPKYISSARKMPVLVPRIDSKQGNPFVGKWLLVCSSFKPIAVNGTL